MAGERRRRRRRVIECAAWRRKKGDREEEWGGGGVGRLVFKNKETRGGGKRERGADRQRRGFSSRGEGRLAGWRRGRVVSVERGGRARLNKAHVQVII